MHFDVCASGQTHSHQVQLAQLQQVPDQEKEYVEYPVELCQGVLRTLAGYRPTASVPTR
jgi:hypothetical protein